MPIQPKRLRHRVPVRHLLRFLTLLLISHKSNPRLIAAVLTPTYTPSRGSCNLSCISGSHLFLNPNDKCECVLDATTEKACIVSTCTAGFYPKWRKDTKTCACLEKETGEASCIAATECPLGSAPVWNGKSNTCSCKKTNTCPDLFCISEQHPVYNATSGKCGCEWIDGFGPAVGKCTDLYCIAEKSPVYDATAGKCHCEWINGFGPGAEKPSSVQLTTTIYTLPPTTADAPGPTVSLGCENLKIYCFGGDHLMHWDPVKQKCSCEDDESSSG